MTTFPNGRHDDQVDSTAQMLDWFKQAGSGVPTTNAGIYDITGSWRGAARCPGAARTIVGDGEAARHPAPIVTVVSSGDRGPAILEKSGVRQDRVR
jgi:hypothetical protein